MRSGEEEEEEKEGLVVLLTPNCYDFYLLRPSGVFGTAGREVGIDGEMAREATEMETEQNTACGEKTKWEGGTDEKLNDGNEKAKKAEYQTIHHGSKHVVRCCAMDHFEHDTRKSIGSTCHRVVAPRAVWCWLWTASLVAGFEAAGITCL
ncbi:hypothetical protein TSMEX_003766 [Taenia solium]|eukprot:TsM_000048800 transcript=TsM_000048800 gene=TsM_000048800